MLTAFMGFSVGLWPAADAAGRTMQSWRRWRAPSLARDHRSRDDDYTSVPVREALAERHAAVSGLALFIVERAVADARTMTIPGLFVACGIQFSFINGVRGTFAFHKAPAAPAA
jgi:hypothetical protein